MTKEEVIEAIELTPLYGELNRTVEIEPVTITEEDVVGRIEIL